MWQMMIIKRYKRTTNNFDELMAHTDTYTHTIGMEMKYSYYKTYSEFEKGPESIGKIRVNG